MYFLFNVTKVQKISQTKHLNFPVILSAFPFGKPFAHQSIKKQIYEF